MISKIKTLLNTDKLLYYSDSNIVNKEKNIAPPQHIEDAYLGFDINSDEKSTLLKKIKKYLL
mgnify:CR=1 FL=1